MASQGNAIRVVYSSTLSRLVTELNGLGLRARDIIHVCRYGEEWVAVYDAGS